MRHYKKHFIFLALLALFTLSAFAVEPAQTQTGETKPLPSPTPRTDDQDRVKIFTEEVFLPIIAYDAFGNFDAALTPDDVLVMEDGISQQVKSARRIPLNLVLLIDMGSVLAVTQNLDLTRSIATRVLSKLRSGDRVVLIQFTNRAEVLQDWTDDIGKVLKVFDPEDGKKLLSGKRSRTSEGIRATAGKLEGKDAGSTHVVLITDGDDAAGSDYEPAIKELLQYQPVFHVLSYTVIASKQTQKQRGGLFFDREMKRFYKEYDKEIKASERRLTALAENFGGRIFLPDSATEALRLGDQLAAEIRATCVLSYTPKRAFESSDNTNPRRIEVFPRRPGLRVRALRTTVARVFK